MLVVRVSKIKCAAKALALCVSLQLSRPEKSLQVNT
jgi:hypothetical protein